MMYDGAYCHDILTKNAKPKLSFTGENYENWKSEIKSKLWEILGLDVIAENACPLKFEIVEETKMDGYLQRRVEFESEYGASVCFYILTPDGMKKGEKRPVVITLQGHNASGVHSSIGNAICHERLDYDRGRGMFAVQSVKEGYVTVAIDQRGMGERKARNTLLRRVSVNPESENCYYEATTALLLGRTLIGERCWDISRTIDLLEAFPECDLDKIVITGNSGGGTASYYAACCDERIKISVPSCAFCTYDESILKYYHCSCNYLPGAYRYFDMQDLACLIAPRRLSIISGKYDTGFKIEGVLRGYETVEKIYTAAGVPENCKLTVTEKGHFWCEDVVWPLIKEELAKL